MTYSVKRRKGNKVNTTFRKKSNKTPGHYSTIEGGDYIPKPLQNLYSKGKDNRCI